MLDPNIEKPHQRETPILSRSEEFHQNHHQEVEGKEVLREGNRLQDEQGAR